MIDQQDRLGGEKRTLPLPVKNVVMEYYKAYAAASAQQQAQQMQQQIQMQQLMQGQKASA